MPNSTFERGDHVEVFLLDPVAAHYRDFGVIRGTVMHNSADLSRDDNRYFEVRLPTGQTVDFDIDKVGVRLLFKADIARDEGARRESVKPAY